MRKFLFIILFVFSYLNINCQVQDYYKDYIYDHYGKWLGSSPSRLDRGLPKSFLLSAYYIQYIQSMYNSDANTADSALNSFNSIGSTSYTSLPYSLDTGAVSQQVLTLSMQTNDTITQFRAEINELDSTVTVYITLLGDTLGDYLLTESILDTIYEHDTLAYNYTDDTIASYILSSVALDSISDLRNNFANYYTQTEVNDKLSRYWMDNETNDSITAKLNRAADTLGNVISGVKQYTTNFTENALFLMRGDSIYYGDSLIWEDGVFKIEGSSKITVSTLSNDTALKVIDDFAGDGSFLIDHYQLLRDGINLDAANGLFFIKKSSINVLEVEDNYVYLRSLDGSNYFRLSNSLIYTVGTVRFADSIDLDGNANIDGYMDIGERLSVTDSTDTPIARVSNKVRADTIQEYSGNMVIGTTGTGDTLTLRTEGTDVLTIDDSQNVGIGTNSPDELLDVAGNVSADTFKYNVADTFFISIGPFAFLSKAPYKDSIEYNTSAGYAIAIDNKSAFVADVRFPDDAVVVEAVVYGDATGETWFLVRANHAGSSTTMATADIGTIDSSITNSTIDNENYSYFMTTLPFDSAEKIYGARIKCIRTNL